MFNMHDFILSGLLDAVGKMADYQIILNSVGWNQKGILEETDLAVIQEAINQKNSPVNPEEPDPLDPMMGIMGKGPV